MNTTNQTLEKPESKDLCNTQGTNNAEHEPQYKASAEKLAEACKLALSANNCTPDIDKMLIAALADWQKESQ